MKRLRDFFFRIASGKSVAVTAILLAAVATVNFSLYFAVFCQRREGRPTWSLTSATCRLTSSRRVCGGILGHGQGDVYRHVLHARYSDAALRVGAPHLGRHVALKKVRNLEMPRRGFSPRRLLLPLRLGEKRLHDHHPGLLPRAARGGRGSGLALHAPKVSPHVRGPCQIAVLCVSLAKNRRR